MRLTAADALLGFQKVIDATFFFRKAIDKARLEASLQALLAVQPMLGSTVRRRGPALHPLEGWEVVSGASEPSLLIEQRSASGTSCKAALEPDPGARFVPVFDGEAVMRGSRQCMGVAHTSFENGGSAVGVAISHAVVDGIGFYDLMTAWSVLHESDCDDASTAAARQLVSSRTALEGLLLSPSLEPTLEGEQARAWDLTTWRATAAWNLLRLLGRSQLQQRPQRASLSFTAEELRSLKRRCQPADTSWRPSTYEALASAVCAAATRLLGVPATSTVRMHLPANIRHLSGLLPPKFIARDAPEIRHPSGLPPKFIGNAFHLLSSPSPCPAPHSVPLVQTCEAFRVLTAPLRSHPARTTAAWLQHLRMLQSGRLPLPVHCSEGSSGSTPALDLFTNFQAKLPAFKVSFGTGPPLRVVPGVGDTVQMVPASAGGIEVFLNLPALPSRPHDWIDVAQSEAFKAGILRGEGDGR